jgi:hypothetical protein
MWQSPLRPDVSRISRHQTPFDAILVLYFIKHAALFCRYRGAFFIVSRV